MDPESALTWVDSHVGDEELCYSLRAAVVARTLADEVRALRAENARLRALVFEP
jgi:hypothetical protein